MDFSQQFSKIAENKPVNESAKFVQKTVKVKDPNYYTKIEVFLNKSFLAKLKAKCSKKKIFLGDFINEAFEEKYNNLKAGKKTNINGSYGEENKRTSADIPKELHGNIKELCNASGLTMKDFKTIAVLEKFEREFL